MSEFIEYCNEFDCIQDDKQSKVFQVFPKVFEDDRGSFTEVLKDFGQWPKDNIPIWFSSLGWIRQINRSVSCPGTVRGCHAQNGIFCQGKLVEALNEIIYDIITDARPNSNTFGVSAIYKLDPNIQNKLWVPKGFLHAFVVPYNVQRNAIFQYYCNNIYSHENEFGISPISLLPKIIDNIKKTQSVNMTNYNNMKNLIDTFDYNHIILSEKDKNGLDYIKWMSNVSLEYSINKKLWYM